MPTNSLTPTEFQARLADRYGYAVTIRTLANWRAAGTGPSFVKHLNRVAYPIADVETWESAHMNQKRK